MSVSSIETVESYAYTPPPAKSATLSVIRTSLAWSAQPSHRPPPYVALLSAIVTWLKANEPPESQHSPPPASSVVSAPQSSSPTPPVTVSSERLTAAAPSWKVRG